MLKTLTDNIIAKLKASDDEDKMVLLIELFHGIDEASLPVVALINFVLTPDKNGDLVLAVNGYEAAYDAVTEIVCLASDRIPAKHVYAELQHVLDNADTLEVDDALIYSIQWMTHLALLARSDTMPFPDTLVTRMSHHKVWQCRESAIDVLTDLKHEKAIVPFLHDDVPDVVIKAIDALSWSAESIVILDQVLSESTIIDQVRTSAQHTRDMITNHLVRQKARGH